MAFVKHSRVHGLEEKTAIWPVQTRGFISLHWPVSGRSFHFSGLLTGSIYPHQVGSSGWLSLSASPRPPVPQGLRAPPPSRRSGAPWPVSVENCASIDVWLGAYSMHQLENQEIN